MMKHEGATKDKGRSMPGDDDAKGDDDALTHGDDEAKETIKYEGRMTYGDEKSQGDTDAYDQQ